MSLKVTDFDAIMNKLQMEIRDSRDKLAWFVYSGRRILSTKRSHGRGDIRGKVPHFIRQQLKVNDKQFQDLIRCPLDREGYINILKEKRIITEDEN
jgi:hypothetical protein